ncbi:MAG: FAD-dependent oxidoreductase [Alphaproteobacteria bacterium]
MPNNQHLDLIVIGGGSGGVRAARRAAGYGAKVALIESDNLGGTCINLGCIPKKLFHHASAVPDQVQDARGFGWDLSTPTLDWTRLLTNKNREISRLHGGYETLLNNANVELIRGHAQLLGTNKVAIGKHTLHGERILLTPGKEPRRPDNVPPAWVSDDLFHLPELPREILIIGGGYIACEFASIFSQLGVETTLLHRRKELMRGFDPNMAKHLASSMAANGIRMLLENSISKVRQREANYEISLANGHELKSEAILWATGRQARVANLNLKSAAVEFDHSGPGGKILVNGDYQTSTPSVFALGDVASRGVELTPIALAEGECFAAKHFKATTPDQIPDLVYENIPTAAFTHPPLAQVGLTPQQAKERGIAAQVWNADFKPLNLALSGRQEQTHIQVVAASEDNRILGVQMLGEEGPDLVQIFALAIKAKATKDQLDQCFAIHPTVAEEFTSLRR